MSEEDELALGIVEAVAERDGVDVTAVEPPLHETVDAAALASLFNSRTDGFVTFTYCGYTIRVDGDGDVRILDPESERPTTTASA